MGESGPGAEKIEKGEGISVLWVPLSGSIKEADKSAVPVPRFRLCYR